jgi:PAS domain S-box-containing protein
MTQLTLLSEESRDLILNFIEKSPYPAIFVDTHCKSILFNEGWTLFFRDLSGTEFDPDTEFLPSILTEQTDLKESIDASLQNGDIVRNILSIRSDQAIIDLSYDIVPWTDKTHKIFGALFRIRDYTTSHKSDQFTEISNQKTQFDIETAYLSFLSKLDMIELDESIAFDQKISRILMEIKIFFKAPQLGIYILHDKNWQPFSDFNGDMISDLPKDLPKTLGQFKEAKNKFYAPESENTPILFMPLHLFQEENPIALIAKGFSKSQENTVLPHLQTYLRRAIQSQEQLKHALSTTQIYTQAIKNARTAILNIDTQTQKLEWRGAALSLLNAKDQRMLPDTIQNFLLMIHADHFDSIQSLFKPTQYIEPTFHEDIQIKTMDGKYIWVSVHGEIQSDEYGMVKAVNMTLHDITKRKTLEQKLWASYEELENFASIASHDLKQPLRSISGFLEILDARYSDHLDDIAKNYIQKSIASTNHINILLEDMLSYARLERTIMNFEPTCLQDQMQIIEFILSNMIDQTGAELIYHDLPTIMASGDHLNRVLINLIENAIKYHRKDIAPIIHISCTRQNQYWMLKITDNGIGIDPSQFEKIFGMFERLHTQQSEYSGTGIGLPICQKIIQRHGGQILVHSDLDKGSEFTLMIPYAPFNPKE